MDSAQAEAHRRDNADVYIKARIETGQSGEFHAADAMLTDHRPAEAAFPGANGKIAFSSSRDGDSEIFAMNPDGSAQTQLTSNTAVDGQPWWSPNGARIAFTSSRDGNNEIYVMNADGSGQTRLTTNAAADIAPNWSPDGTKVAFQTGRTGNEEVFVINATGAARPT